VNLRPLDKQPGPGVAGEVDAHVTKPRLLDLFCGAGGCARGYQRAGFYVVGVDNRPQPRYAGDEFVQADALEYVRDHGHEFDAIHASPPCQGYSDGANNIHGRPTTRCRSPTCARLLEATGLPYVIENVEGARKHMRDPVTVCGLSLGLNVRRHRLFECNFPSWSAVRRPPRRLAARLRSHGARARPRRRHCEGRRPRHPPQAHDDRARSRGDGHRLDDSRRTLPGHPARVLRTSAASSSPRSSAAAWSGPHDLLLKDERRHGWQPAGALRTRQPVAVHRNPPVAGRIDAGALTHDDLGRVRAGVMSLLETEALMPKTGGGLPSIATSGQIAEDLRGPRTAAGGQHGPVPPAPPSRR
jgi:hypothetical protein